MEVKGCGYFRWRIDSDGKASTRLNGQDVTGFDAGPAPDGELWFLHALYRFSLRISMGVPERA